MNAKPGISPGRALLFSALLLAPLAMHLALMAHRFMAVAGILIVVQAVLVTWIALESFARRIIRVGACATVFLLTLSVCRFADNGPAVASALPHAMAYLTLLAVFAPSLLPGREAVVTIFARKARGHLPDRVLRYTRRVTWAWCWFAVIQLIGSMLLLRFAPLSAWSLFVNACNLPLVGILLGAEYAYRQWRYASEPPERLADICRVFKQMRTGPIREDL